MTKITNPPFEERFFNDISINVKERIIFHYTTAAGALGIFEGAQIWTSLATHMNDKQECKFAHGVARRIAHGELRQSDAILREAFLAEFREQLERYEHLKVFVACFSEAHDLLSQWRGYGGMLGYALGFSLESVQRIAEKQGFKLEEVKYKNAEHEALLRPIVVDLIAKFDPGWDRTKHREQIDNSFRPGMTAIAEKSAIIKHPAFSEEREWRLHSNPMAPLQDRTDFVVREGRIVPIVKVNLESGKTTHPRFYRDICLRGCVVGPGPDQEERTDAIWTVALRHQVSIGQIMRSAAPVR